MAILMERPIVEQQGYTGVMEAAALGQERVLDRLAQRPEMVSPGSSNVSMALVHDYLNQYGGAERVLEVLHTLFPRAPVYTSIYAPKSMPAHFRSWDVRTSFM